jgi:SSS family solute:Na+ symporter
MSNLLPAGLRGLVAAGLLAALMSSLASVFNSVSTLFTIDIYKKLKPNSPENKLVRTGQIATIVVVIIGIIWIPIMSNISGVLYEYLQSVQTYIAPPIAAVFIMGIFHKRINAQGAFITLITGLVIGFSRIFLEILSDSLTPGSFLHTIGTINYLTFGAWFFLFCVLLIIVVSLITSPPLESKIRNLTFQTISEQEKEVSKSAYNWIDIFISLIVVIIVICVMFWFNGR